MNPLYLPPARRTPQRADSSESHPAEAVIVVGIFLLVAAVLVMQPQHIFSLMDAITNPGPKPGKVVSHRLDIVQPAVAPSTPLAPAQTAPNTSSMWGRYVQEHSRR